jgi:hypothetical protein
VISDKLLLTIIIIIIPIIIIIIVSGFETQNQNDTYAAPVSIFRA